MKDEDKSGLDTETGGTAETGAEVSERAVRPGGEVPEQVRVSKPSGRALETGSDPEKSAGREKGAGFPETGSEAAGKVGDPKLGSKAAGKGGKAPEPRVEVSEPTAKAQERGAGDQPAPEEGGKPRRARRPKKPQPEIVHRAGFAVIFGAPNAGKSTLLNRILGEKVAAVAAKPQTTRHKILGVLTRPMAQLVFYDTPGYHESEKLLNQGIVSRAVEALADADAVLFLTDGLHQGEEHLAAMELVKAKERSKIVCAVSKSDQVREKYMRPITAEISSIFPGVPVLPVSSKNGNNIGRIIGLLSERLPESPRLFPDDTLTDQSMRQIAAEFVREAVIRHTHNEIPYSTAVTVDRYEEPAKAGLRKTYIAATIHVEKDNQKVIVVGSGGRKLQSIGTLARENIERLVGGPVYLDLFVRTTRDWSKRKASLQDFGYRDRS
ncbi:MAG: GTPase Era [Deltaproteobacteria bacterium]|jgi:GTP-binding protein Era|nr:GTPase Era [Deltaproteobacteria bacterium]